jgi:hypothetical protein
MVTKYKVGREDGSGWVLVWDRDDPGLFSFCTYYFTLQSLFPFPFVPLKLIGDFFDNRQQSVNCLVSFSFLNFFWLPGLERPENSQHDRTAGMTGQQERLESWNDRKA